LYNICTIWQLAKKNQKTVFVFVFFTFYWRQKSNMAARRELRQIAQKEEFLFCLHFIGYKIQTLARRRELRQKMFCFCFVYILLATKFKEQKIFCFVYILVATWRVCSNMTNWPKNTKIFCFSFCFVYILLAPVLASSQQVP
jgi:hypothetical protein